MFMVVEVVWDPMLVNLWPPHTATLKGLCTARTLYLTFTKSVIYGYGK